MTIAAGPEEPNPVVVTAPDTVTHVALLDALDRDLERKDAEFVGGVANADTNERQA